MRIKFDQHTIRTNINNERKRKGWGYAKLASMMAKQGVQMDRDVPWRIEQGTYEVSMRELRAFAKLFRRDVNFFYQTPDTEAPKDVDYAALGRLFFEKFGYRADYYDAEYWTEFAKELLPDIERITTNTDHQLAS